MTVFLWVAIVLFPTKGVFNMNYISEYLSPKGKLTMTADEKGLTGLWFGEAYESERPAEIFDTVKAWLDIYFSGKEPPFCPPLHLTGSDFQLGIWELLLEIPYGETVSYKEIARRYADKNGIPRMSAQAVGGAVGKNKIAIIVPCHRVIGADGSLTGYAGGLDKKEYLLSLEAG